MFEVRYAISDPATGAAGVLVVRGGVWAGDECVFEFAETATGVAGVARCDWRQAAPRLDVTEGDPDGGAHVLAALSQVLLPFHRGAFRGVRDEALAELYAGDYHRQMNYANDAESERAFKRHVTEVLLSLGDLGKTVDAGCSAGEVVRQLRARGVDAWGFDLCRDLERIAYPEVRPFVRQGSVTAIPFARSDGFETLVALDLFEHVPEDRVATMVAEFARLGVRRIVAHIALCEFQYPGHITLRPLHWWDRQLAPSFARSRERIGAAAVARGFGADPSKYLRVYELVEAPVLVG